MANVEIFVNAAAAPGGDGTSEATAYQTIKAAVDDANGRGGNATIRVAAGTYVDATNALTITRANVKILGSTVLQLDARGLPTGAVADVVRWKPAVTSGLLLKVTASNFEVSGIVFDGGKPRSSSGASLLLVDGIAEAASRRLLADISIHGNCFQDASQALRLSHANAVVADNYIARSFGGLQCSGGFANPANPDLELRVAMRRNRVEDIVNIAAVFGGHPSQSAASGNAGPGASHVEITDNDFARNGDCRDATNGVYYPAPIQYAAVVFNVIHESSDTLQTARTDAVLRDNTFRKNAYAMAMAIRVPTTAGTAKYELHATLAGNTYCSNGLNDLFVDFNLPSQSHLGAAATTQYRHAVGAVCTIDATGDGLTLDDVDYDHPECDPRLPLSAPGTLVLGNTFVFNEVPVPPHATYLATDPPPEITRPASGSVPLLMVDRKPPWIRSVTATPNVLWPPNSKMVAVAIAVDAKDGCDPDPTREIVSVTSSDPLGADPDWEITGPLSLQLRAKRPGTGARTYTVTVRCTDDAGNSSTKDVTVTVPHSQP
jgi:hypothetical protein